MKLGKGVLAACAITVAGGGVLAAVVIGDEANGGHGIEVGRENAPVLPTHPVTAPGAGNRTSELGGTAATRRRKPRVSYFETNPVLVDQASLAATLRCPVRNKAIGGYFVTDHPGLVLDYSAVSGFTGPFRPRRWSLEVIYAQTNNAAHNVQFGVVCISGVG